MTHVAVSSGSTCRALVAFATVGAGVAAVAVALPLPPAAAAVAFGLFAVVAATALARLDRHPHSRFGLANLITLARAGGACLFAGLALAPGLLTDGGAWVTAAAVVALLALDGIDGWVARREGLSSAYGARFDMETDALTILALSALALTLDKAGPWVLMLGLMRYAFVAAGWAWPALEAPMPPSLRRKAVCVLQIGILAVLLAPTLTPPLSSTLAAVALVALAWSFAVDTLCLIRSTR